MPNDIQWTEQVADSYKKELEATGNLDIGEIQELIQLEYRTPFESFDEQVRKGYLRLKSADPEHAAKMLLEAKPFLERGIRSVEDARAACITLYKYCSLAVHFNSKTYYASGGKFFEFISDGNAREI